MKMSRLTIILPSKYLHIFVEEATAYGGEVFTEPVENGKVKTKPRRAAGETRRPHTKPNTIMALATKKPVFRNRNSRRKVAFDALKAACKGKHFTRAEGIEWLEVVGKGEGSVRLSDLISHGAIKVLKRQKQE